MSISALVRQELRSLVARETQNPQLLVSYSVIDRDIECEDMLQSLVAFLAARDKSYPSAKTVNNPTLELFLFLIYCQPQPFEMKLRSTLQVVFNTPFYPLFQSLQLTEECTVASSIQVSRGFF